MLEAEHGLRLGHRQLVFCRWTGTTSSSWKTAWRAVGGKLCGGHINGGRGGVIRRPLGRRRRESFPMDAAKDGNGHDDGDDYVDVTGRFEQRLRRRRRRRAQGLRREQHPRRSSSPPWRGGASLPHSSPPSQSHRNDPPRDAERRRTRGATGVRALATAPCLDTATRRGPRRQAVEDSSRRPGPSAAGGLIFDRTLRSWTSARTSNEWDEESGSPEDTISTSDEHGDNDERPRQRCEFRADSSTSGATVAARSSRGGIFVSSFAGYRSRSPSPSR